MSRGIPRYLLRDTLIHQRFSHYTPTRKVYKEGVEVRCYWEAQTELMQTQQGVTYVRSATVIVPKWDLETRSAVHRHREYVTPRTPGVRLPAEGQPMLPVGLPVALVREDIIDTVEEVRVPTFHVQDRVVKDDVKYQIVDITEWDKNPQGVDHLVLTVADQNG